MAKVDPKKHAIPRYAPGKARIEQEKARKAGLKLQAELGVAGSNYVTRKGDTTSETFDRAAGGFEDRRKTGRTVAAGAARGLVATGVGPAAGIPVRSLRPDMDIDAQVRSTKGKTRARR